MRIERPYRHKMRVTLTVEYDTYCDHTDHYKHNRERTAATLRREALERAINPDYKDGDHVRVTHVEVMDFREIPDFFENTFRDIIREMQENHDENGLTASLTASDCQGGQRIHQGGESGSQGLENGKNDNITR